MSCEAQTPLASSALGRSFQLRHMARDYKSRARRGIFHLFSSAQKIHPQTRAHFKRSTAVAREQSHDHTEGLPQGISDGTSPHEPSRTKFLGIFARTEQKAHSLDNHPAVQTEVSPAFQTHHCAAGAQARNQCGLELKGEHEKKKKGGLSVLISPRVTCKLNQISEKGKGKGKGRGRKEKGEEKEGQGEGEGKGRKRKERGEGKERQGKRKGEGKERGEGRKRKREGKESSR